jgi:hypothetical protein
MNAKYRILTLLLAIASVSCGKSVRLSQTSIAEIEKACGPGNLVRWSFVQPEATRNSSVDLLLVVDSSTSLSEERARIASTLPSFLSALPEGADLRIGVMQGHGGTSSYTGKLYSPAGVPRVLDTAKISTAQIQSQLEKSLSTRVADPDDANGEALMFSLMRSLDADRIETIRSQGFYRESAALSVVFITDENDICYKPDDHGYTAFPDFVPSRNPTTEVKAYDKNCSGITPEGVVSRMETFKGGQVLSFGGIVHIDPARVPPLLSPNAFTFTEDAIGHGILELVQSSRNGLAWDITDTDFAEGLSKLGNIVTTQLTLQTLFHLAGAEGTNLQGIAVEVDGKIVPHSYDSGRTEIQLSAQAAGKARSTIEVAACKR